METFSITISPPEKVWKQYFKMEMPKACKTLSKKGSLLYSEEKESHGHIMIECDQRIDNLKRTLKSLFPKYVKNLEGLAKKDDFSKHQLSITFKVKKHDDPLLLMGYITKDWIDPRKPPGQYFKSGRFCDITDKEFKEAKEYYKGKKTGIKGWECKSVNLLMDYAYDWTKKQNITWKWEVSGTGTRYRSFPNWKIVIARLHTLNLIPTSLAIKVMKKQFEELWLDKWTETSLDEIISYEYQEEL